MSEEYPGLIRLPTMMPDGTIAIVWWPASEPLPETFTLNPTPDNPGICDIIVETKEHLK
jgi:hypothetical protein